MHDKSTLLTICFNGNTILSKAAVQLHKEFVWPVFYHVILTLPLKQKKSRLLRLVTVTVSKLFWSLTGKAGAGLNIPCQFYLSQRINFRRKEVLPFPDRELCGGECNPIYKVLKKRELAPGDFYRSGMTRFEDLKTLLFN